MEGDVQEYPHIWICGLQTFLVMREISCVERRLVMLKVCRSAVGVCCDLHSLCYRDVQILELLAVESTCLAMLSILTTFFEFQGIIVLINISCKLCIAKSCNPLCGAYDRVAVTMGFLVHLGD